MNAPEIDRLIDLMARLPGLGPRSAKRAVLHLLKQRNRLMDPLAQALADAAANVTQCSTCGNLDARDPCMVCQKAATGGRDASLICVVEDVADLWALERAGVYRGLYHVLGGVLNALDGVGPDDLNLAGLVDRARDPKVTEVILALNATVDGQTTAHYVASQLETAGVKLTGLAQGVPLGGELDYLDDGTLAAALKARKDI